MILNASYEKEEGWTNIREIEILAIDYMTVNDKVIDKVDIVKKENRMQSGHTPLEMQFNGLFTKKLQKTGVVKKWRKVIERKRR